MPIPNPHNGYIPSAGETVRIVGACHPRMLGQIVEVHQVDGDFVETKWLDKGEWMYTTGEIGGLEPVEKRLGRPVLSVEDCLHTPCPFPPESNL